MAMALCAKSRATTSKPSRSKASGSGLRPAPGTRIRHGASAADARQAVKAGLIPPRSHGVRLRLENDFPRTHPGTSLIVSLRYADAGRAE